MKTLVYSYYVADSTSVVSFVTEDCTNMQIAALRAQDANLGNRSGIIFYNDTLICYHRKP